MPEHEERKAQLIKTFGNNKVSNTLKLQAKHRKALIDADINGGSVERDFNSWAKKNFPNVKIVKG